MYRYSAICSLQKYTVFSLKIVTSCGQKNRHALGRIRIGINKMAKGAEYLSRRNIREGEETLERFIREVSRDKIVGFELSEDSTSDR